MAFQIRLTTRDGQQVAFDCERNENLIAAASASNISLPSQCRRGSCGVCHASVAQGDYLFDPHNREALPAQLANGILMCQTTPLGDLDIALPYDHAKILFRPLARRQAEIVALDPVAESTVRLELRLDDDAEYGCAAEFEPGQFMELELPETEERRAYSLANTSNWDGQLEFLIRLRTNGLFSRFLRERAQVGMKLMVRGASGGFGILEGSLRPRWFVAGGTGLSPILSMLRRMAEYQDTQEARLFFGVNRENELFAIDEIERLKSELPQLKVDVCVWTPEGQWGGFVGTAADALRRAFVSSQVKPDLYLCGPAPLVKSCEDVAAQFEVPAGQIFCERFLPPQQVE